MEGLSQDLLTKIAVGIVSAIVHFLLRMVTEEDNRTWLQNQASQLGQISHRYLTGQIPDDWQVELSVMAAKLRQAGQPERKVRLKILREQLGMLVAVVVIKIQNLWLPNQNPYR